jgi:hypothetical protein
VLVLGIVKKIPDPAGKKASDPGFGSATLIYRYRYLTEADLKIPIRKGSVSYPIGVLAAAPHYSLGSITFSSLSVCWVALLKGQCHSTTIFFNFV